MSPLDKCIAEQAACAAQFPDSGAALGAQDWIREECMIRLESDTSE